MGRTPRQHDRARGAAKRGLLLAFVWVVLTAGARDGLILGLAVVPAATWLSLHLLPYGGAVRLWRLAALLPGFLARSLVGGLDVAWRAFHPRMPLAPGWMERASRLPDGGRVALGGELSLMPGTLAAGSRGGRIILHVLDTTQDNAATITREEARLAALAAPEGRS